MALVRTWAMPQKPVAPAVIRPAPTNAVGAKNQGERARPSTVVTSTIEPAAICTCRCNSSGALRSVATQCRVRDIMRAPVISAGEDASLADLSDLMMKHGIKRVLILRDGVLVGVVSRADVLRAVVGNLQGLLEPTD
jgi:CBS domain-containing protein